MSSSVSYELFSSKIGGISSGFTVEGGMYETFINNTGISVKGTIVIASLTVTGGVDIAPANTQMPIGVIYENGIANGSLVKVVVYGKADVLLKNGEAANRGYWCGVSDIAGRMYQLSSVPATTEHSREIGHSIEDKTGGTNILSRVQIHFN